MGKWLKENAIAIISLLLTFGGAIAAFAFGALEMLAAYPLQSSLLVFSAIALGFFLFRFIETQTRYAWDKKTLEEIKGLPPQLISAIYRAYVDGSYDANIYDSTVQYLLDLGYFGAPSAVPRLYETHFILKPWFKGFLDRHHDQVFGSSS